MKKYKMLKTKKKEFFGHTLYRIKALRNFGNVKKGEIGGWIEKEENLSHTGDCWVYDEGKVMDDGWVFGDGRVYGNAIVRDNGIVSGHGSVNGNSVTYDNCEINEYGFVSGDSRVFGNGIVSGKGVVRGDNVICGNAICTKPTQFISGMRSDITITDNHIQVGCMQFKISTFKNLRFSKEIKRYCSLEEFKYYKRLILTLLESK